MLNKKYGFTIIEVVLVLAIAGLIFLMVFVALPSLQRSQRDAQRRQDAAKVAAAITQYQSNNGSDIPLPHAAGADVSYVGLNGKYSPSNDNIPCESNSSKLLHQFRCNYLGGSEFKDPNGEEYRLRTIYRKSIFLDESSSPNNFIQIVRGVNCSNYNDANAVANAELTNNYAILIRLENSGIYCLDN